MYARFIGSLERLIQAHGSRDSLPRDILEIAVYFPSEGIELPTLESYSNPRCIFSPAKVKNTYRAFLATQTYSHILIQINWAFLLSSLISPDWVKISMKIFSFHFLIPQSMLFDSIIDIFYYAI